MTGYTTEIQPTMRRTVEWVRSLGFATTDSGDGVLNLDPMVAEWLADKLRLAAVAARAERLGDKLRAAIRGATRKVGR